MSDTGKTLSAERIQETNDNVLSIGEVFKGVCDSGMTPSTTTIVSSDLAGFGDDYFNNDWVLIIMYNDNSHGAAPESETQNITDYVSATGTFTTAAFTANIEPSDIVMVAYTKHNQFAIGAEILTATGNHNVQIDDIGEYNMAIYDVGNVVPGIADINEGNYQIDRIREGVLTNIVPTAAALKSDGRIYITEKFDTVSGWAAGDLARIRFANGSITIAGITTYFPQQNFYTRITNRVSLDKPIFYNGTIANLNVNTEQDLITEVTVSTASEIDLIIIDFTNWLADASIAASGATLTIRVYLDDNNGTLREIGNLQDIVTEGISPGSMIKIDGIGTFERNFKVTVQSSVAPTGGAGSDLVKYHYGLIARE